MAHLGDNTDTESLARVFIEDGEHLVTPPTAQLVVDEVDAPDVVLVLRPQADDGAVFVVEAFTSLMVNAPVPEAVTVIAPVAAVPAVNAESVSAEALVVVITISSVAVTAA